MSEKYYLGIDGGGTKTLFRLADAYGRKIKDVCKGPSNPNDIGMDAAMALLKEGINEVCGDISHADIVMFAGLSGGGMTGNNAEKFKHFFENFDFCAFENGSDIENLVSLTEEGRRVLVIMGTGFIVYALDGEMRRRIAGWGQFFDDGGSGYTLGRDAITAVLDAFDGSGEATLLTALLEVRIGEPAEKHLGTFYRGGKSYIASFADLVFVAAERGDHIAANILERNMAFVAEKIRTALLGFSAGEAEIPVYMAGGLTKRADVLFPLIEKHLANASCKLLCMDKEPVEGALRRAKTILIEKRREHQ